MPADTISASNLADIMGVSRATVRKWEASGKIAPLGGGDGGQRLYDMRALTALTEIKEMVESDWEAEAATRPAREYTSVELFAGAGGMALGMSMAGFRHLLLNEIDHNACQTLLRNRPDWHVAEGDIHKLDFARLEGQVDLLAGGFPCQAFSYAGNKKGFGDTRGTLFFELARAVRQTRPKVFLGENVRGLLSHDGGKTLATIRNAIAELGYTLVEPQVLRAVKYRVPQKRERLFLVAIRNDLAHKAQFRWPSPYRRVMTMRDALYAGELFPSDVPPSDGQRYPEKKRRFLDLVPQGGDWRDLPPEAQREYMGGSYHLEGGKTGMARRLHLDEPSLTLTCAPAQKQTERCHPTETRPLSVREYARVQTFPDEWQFSGTLSQQYKQIGNAVPVNLAHAMARAIVRLLNDIERQG